MLSTSPGDFHQYLQHQFFCPRHFVTEKLSNVGTFSLLNMFPQCRTSTGWQPALMPSIYTKYKTSGRARGQLNKLTIRLCTWVNYEVRSSKIKHMGVGLVVWNVDARNDNGNASLYGVIKQRFRRLFLWTLHHCKPTVR